MNLWLFVLVSDVFLYVDVYWKAERRELSVSAEVILEKGAAKGWFAKNEQYFPKPFYG